MSMMSKAAPATAGRFQVSSRTCIAAVALLMGATLMPGFADAKTNVTYSKSSKSVKGTKFTIYEKKTTGSGALRITASKSHIWFAEHTTGRPVRLNTKGKGTEFDQPTPGIIINAVTYGPDKKVWFMGFNDATIGSISQKGKYKLYDTGAGTNSSNSIITGPDGNIWFASDFMGIGRTKPNNGKTKLYPIKANSDQPTTLAVGKGGLLWFIEWVGDEIGSIDTKNGKVKEYNIGFSKFSNSFGIAFGPDKRVWFADPERNRICRIKTNGKSLKCFTKGLSGRPATIIAGPDGKLYFGTYEGHVGVITTKGKATAFKIPRQKGVVWPVLGMTIGPDGNIWFADNASARIGRMHIK